MKAATTLAAVGIAASLGPWLGFEGRVRAAASAPADAAMQEQIVAKEREGLDALKAGNVAHFGELTADEAIFVDARGPAGKAEVMKNVVGFTLVDYSITDVRFVRLSATSGLIAYKIEEKGNSHGHEFTARVYVSSVWAQQGGKWLCLFSQETGARAPAPVAVPSP